MKIFFAPPRHTALRTIFGVAAKLHQQGSDPDHQKGERHQKHDSAGQRHQRAPGPAIVRFLRLFFHRHSHRLYLKNQIVAPEATTISTIVSQKVSIRPGNATFMP